MASNTIRIHWFCSPIRRPRSWLCSWYVLAKFNTLGSGLICSGWNYWFKYIVTTPNNLIATVLVIKYWFNKREYDGPGAAAALYVALFLAAIIAINYFGVGIFGEFEFWYLLPHPILLLPLMIKRLSSVKVLIIFGLIIFTIVLAAGGGPTHDATGFRYWHEPGAFAAYRLGWCSYTINEVKC